MVPLTLLLYQKPFKIFINHLKLNLMKNLLFLISITIIITSCAGRKHVASKYDVTKCPTWVNRSVSAYK